MTPTATRPDPVDTGRPGWAILAGYPIKQTWPEYPAFQKVQTVLTDEQERSGGRCVREDPRIVVATGTAILLGWILFRPFLDRARSDADRRPLRPTVGR